MNEWTIWNWNKLIFIYISRLESIKYKKAISIALSLNEKKNYFNFFTFIQVEYFQDKLVFFLIILVDNLHNFSKMQKLVTLFSEFKIH